MRKFISYAALAAVLFMLGVQQIFAVWPPVLEPIVVPMDCTVFGTCAVYVDDKNNPNGAPTGAKDDWYESITDAVNKVKTDADYNTIIIAEGEYSLNGTPESMPFVFDDTNVWGTSKGIYVEGGYAEGFNDRDPDTYRTIIDANDGVNNVFKVKNLAGRISGLEITNVNGAGTAPVHIENKGATSHTFTVEYNKFYGNNIGLGSQSVWFDLDGSNKGKFYGNEVTDNPGTGLNSVFSIDGQGEVYQNVFESNTSYAGVSCAGGALVFNNFILNNTVNMAANIYGDCDFYNNSVIGNKIEAGATYAAIYMTGNTNKVANNLVAFNSGNQSFYHNVADTSDFEYNALYDNGTDPAAASLTDGNVICDPLFGTANYTNPDNLKFGDGSECMDKGKTVSSVTKDFFDTARPLDGDGTGGAQYDPGAYEAPAYTAPPSTTAPEITGLGVSPATFSPDGDGDDDTTTISFNISDNADVTVTIMNSSDVELNMLMDNVAKSAGSVLLTWDGKNELSQVVEDGTYTVKVDISNTNGDDSAEVDVDVDTTGQSSGGPKCAGYSDVPAAHPSCDAIEYMQSIGAMTGNPDGTFAPDDYLQRDQVAKIVLVTFDKFDDGEDYCDGTDPFPDVKSTDWAYQYICRGVDLGMITGYEGGEDAGYYRPARSVNRVEFLALTLRNLSDTMPDLNSTSYVDVQTNQWYSGYAKYSYDNSLFTGQHLYPSQFTKRHEVADVIYKLHEDGKI